jgi:tetratricopeptide (TPR) repeat protein
MKCLKVSPGFIEAIINLANLYSISGSYSQAISYYNAAIKIQPNNAGNYYGLALAYLKTGDRDKYIEQLRKTISVSPDHFEAHFKLAMIYADSDIETTKKELLEVIRIKPDFAMGYFNIGIACMKLGKKELTKYYWDKYLGMEHDRSMDQMIIQWIADN